MPSAAINAIGGVISGIGKASAASTQAKAYLAAAKLKAAGYKRAGQISAKGATKAAKVAATGFTTAGVQQVGAGDEAIASQRGALDQVTSGMKPYTDMGRGATYSLADLYGLPTAQNPQGGQPLSDQALDAFRRSPDYEFALEEGIKGADRSAAARGGLISGGQQAGVARLSSGLATQNFGNYFNRLLQLSQMGEGAQEYVGNAQQETGRGVATTQLAQGDARARATLGASGATAAGITGAAGARATGVAGGSSAFADALGQAANINAAGTAGAYGDISQGVSDAFNQASFLNYIRGANPK